VPVPEAGARDRVGDKLPPIEGIDEFYGKSVHHCPYCDAWEHQDQRMAVYGKGKPAMGLAMSLKTWTPDVVLCTDGRSGLAPADKQMLADLEIGLRTQRISRLEGEGGRLQRIAFRKGDPVECSAMFFNTGQNQACGLAGQFNCKLTPRGTNRWERTSVPGLYAAGDCSRNVQWVVVAAAEGAIAAEAINMELQEEDRRFFLARKRHSA
jgi:thioredoxin reductase